jgi:pimeloyl-ACP methyl ester carboxylesterase
MVTKNQIMEKITKSISSIYPQFRTIDGLSIRFAESDDSHHHTQALLLCPWPESIFAFEPVWSKLSERTHLVAVDLPGFGHSEYRDSLMSPKAMGEFVVRLADEFEMEHPHVVGPDIGTGAALFAAALYPERLRSLVIGSGGSAFPLQLGGVLKEWVEAPSIEPYRQMDGRIIVNIAIDSLENYKPSDIAREDYLSAYKGERFAESMRYVRSYPTDLAILKDLLPDIQTPVLIIAGQRDNVVPATNAEFLHDRLPKSKLAFVNAVHFTWEDAADEYAALIMDWWNQGHTFVQLER